MIVFDIENRMVKDTLLAKFRGVEKAIELDVHLVEFDDVRYRIQAAANDKGRVSLSIFLPQSPPEVVTNGGLPLGAIEAVNAAYGSLVQIVNPPEDGFHLTLAIELDKLSEFEEEQVALANKLSSLRSVVLGASLREILSSLAKGKVSEDADALTAVMHRPHESYFVIPQAEKVTVVFPMRFKDQNDAVLATAFLQEFMEARRASTLSAAPPCSYSASPPLELKSAPAHALLANAGFVSFVVFGRHVEGPRLDKTVWILSTFYAYVSYHIKCSKAFMHTRMRRRVESLIQVLNRAKPDVEREKKTISGRTFKRPTQSPVPTSPDSQK